MNIQATNTIEKGLIDVRDMARAIDWGITRSESEGGEDLIKEEFAVKVANASGSSTYVSPMRTRGGS